MVDEMPKDIVKELHIRAAIEQISGTLFERAANEIEQLRKERDEARRMWCEAAPVGNCLSVDDMNRRARAEAKRRGWDCFKENTNAR